MTELRQHAVLEDFWRWEAASLVEVVADLATASKDYFMPADTLRMYFEANGGQKLAQILSAIFNTDDFPIHPESILQGHTAVFCILLRIGRGKHIEQFASYEELSDQRLPFDHGHPPPYFPAADDPTFLQEFCENQWMYCVPVLDSHMISKHFGPRRLLPIAQAEKRGTDGSVTTYKVRLYEPYNKLQPTASNMMTSQMNCIDSNTFILKRYPKDSGSQYMEDINGFRALKHPESITRFCGSFIHGDEYNVLLEYADKGSLDEYFQKEAPPSRGVDIIKFWEGLFKLLDALKAIHTVLGSHQNIRPSNILVMSYGAESPSDWKFKLANFGQSKRKSPIQEDATAEDGGSLTYSAPECQKTSELDDPQSCDVWSLGCIYSEAAIWIADGYKGLTDYRRQRMAESNKNLDCFHNGDQALSAVLGAHAAIEESLRRSDYITKDVLDSMVDEMLWEEDRPKVKALLRKAEGLLVRARLKLPNVGDESPILPRSHTRILGPPILPPPTSQLPEIPRRPVPLRSPSTSEGQYLPHVEQWRSQVTISQISGLQSGRPASEGPIPGYGIEEGHDPESLSDLSREINGSIASWQGHDSSTLVSPITPFSSRQPSLVYNDRRNLAIDGRPPVPTRNIGRLSAEHKSPNDTLQEPSYTASESGIVDPSIRETRLEPSPEIVPMSQSAIRPTSPSTISSPTIMPTSPPTTSPPTTSSPTMDPSASMPMSPAVIRPTSQPTTSSPTIVPMAPPPTVPMSPAAIRPTSQTTTSPPAIVPTSPPKTMPMSPSAIRPAPLHMVMPLSPPPHTVMSLPQPKVVPISKPPTMPMSAFTIKPTSPPTIVPKAPPSTMQMSPTAMGPISPYTFPPESVQTIMPKTSQITMPTTPPTIMSQTPSTIMPTSAPTNLPMSLPTSQRDSSSIADDSKTITDEIRTIDPNSRNSSSTYSNPFSDPITQNEEISHPRGASDTQVSPASQKRSAFNLFPAPMPSAKLPLLSSSNHYSPSVSSTRSDVSIPVSLPVARPETAQTATAVSPYPVQTLPESSLTDYFSVTAALDWKNAHKKAKKRERVPPLPGAHLLEELKERDHVFIVDDAASMKDSWTDVKRVFEALSYIVKGMSPDGTDLFYTVSYDTWRRRDTSDLCEYLEKKPVGGKTDIKYRLDLQFRSYFRKIEEVKDSKKKMNKLRPLSFYILTNGDWAAGSDAKTAIRSMVDFLVTTGVETKKSGIEMKKFPVTIQFISFARTEEALQRMSDLVNEDFGGVNIVDCTPCIGNVLKMLRGPLDRKARSMQVQTERIVNLSAPRLEMGPPAGAPLKPEARMGTIWGGELA